MSQNGELNYNSPTFTWKFLTLLFSLVRNDYPCLFFFSRKLSQPVVVLCRSCIVNQKKNDLQISERDIEGSCCIHITLVKMLVSFNLMQSSEVLGAY